MPTMTSIPSTRVLNLMCRLLGDYKAGANAKATLDELRQELGQDEYMRFRNDLLREMRQVPAWKAIGNIIAAAIQRKKAVTDANRAGRVNA